MLKLGDQVMAAALENDYVGRYVASGHLDEKGRMIGTRIALRTCRFYMHTIRQYESWRDAPEGAVAGATGYTVRFQGTRDARDYGSSNPERVFLTREEREAEIERYLADVRKRAAKKRAA